jgi:hypothetical protein
MTLRHSLESDKCESSLSLYSIIIAHTYETLGIKKPIVQIVSDDAMMRNNKFQLIESVIELRWKRIVIKFVYGWGVKKF